MPADTTPAAVTAAVTAAVAAPSSASSSAPPPGAAGAASPSSASPTAAPPAARESAMSDFDKQFSDLEEAPKTAPAPAAAPPAPKAPDKPAEKPAEKPAAKPAAAKAPEADDEFTAPQSATMIQLRNFGKRMANMAKAAQGKARELEAKVQELEARAPQVPADVAKIQADYQRLVKENEDYRARITQNDYAHSPEYREKYEAPYEEIFAEGREETKTLKVATTNPETDEVTYRDATAADFDQIYDMSNWEADKAAKAMFGESANRVLELRNQAKRLAKKAYLAIQQNASKYAETKKAQEAQSSSQKIALRGLWKKVNDDLQTKHAEWFGERDDDKEWNGALAKGKEIARQRFSDAYSHMAPEQRVVLDAQISNRVAAFTPMRVLIGRQNGEIAELKKSIEALRASGPGKPTPGTTETEAPVVDDLEEGKRRGIF